MVQGWLQILNNNKNHLKNVEKITFFTFNTWCHQLNTVQDCACSVLVVAKAAAARPSWGRGAQKPHSHFPEVCFNTPPGGCIPRNHTGFKNGFYVCF